MKPNLSVRLDLPSSMSMIDLLDAVIEKIVVQSGFDEGIASEINLAVIEAGTNAIEHGNKLDPSKRAKFDFTISPEKLTITVEDQGDGFDPNQNFDPLDPESLLSGSGRGLFLIEACMDEIEYLDDGRKILMTKKINDQFER